MAEAARDYLSIGEVLVALKPEFPDITISKIRFLEGEGLVAPERTSSGYRKFYDKDVDRLRKILKLQRDEYLPLKVIRERLDGAEPDTQSGGTGTVSGTETGTRNDTRLVEEQDDALPEPSPSLRMSAEELAGAAGVSEDVVESLTSFGLLRPRESAGQRMFNGDDLVVLRVAKEFFKYGVEPRHLTMYRHFCDREATFFQQIVMPVLRQRNPEARKQASESIAELVRNSRRLKQALLRANLREHLG